MTDDLIERWRKTRSPRLADEIQALGPHGAAKISKMRGASTARRYVLALDEEPDDPRLTPLFLDWIKKPMWPSSGARPMYESILARLVKLRDRRAIEPLRRMAKDLPQFTGVAHGKRMAVAIAKAAAELEQACAGIADDGWVPPVTEAPKARASVEQVWANPDDDQLKLVVADALVETGDPWGEFILCQMRGEKERAETLLHKHGTIFGGPIAQICRKESWTFEKGFLVKVAANRSMVPRRRWEDAVKAPHWATVRELVLDANDTPKWWIAELFRNPATSRIARVTVEYKDVEIVRTKKGWKVTKCGPWMWPMVAAFAGGTTGEIELARDLPEREDVEEAIAKARSKGRPRTS